MLVATPAAAAIAFGRMDGVSIGSIEIDRNKAWTDALPFIRELGAGKPGIRLARFCSPNLQPFAMTCGETGEEIMMPFKVGLCAVVAMILCSTTQGQERKPAQQPFDDAEFVKMAASDGMHEVMLGKIGSQKASRADVKKFAERMVADHTKAGEELKTAAKEAGVAVPEQMSDEHQKHVDKFKNYAGDNFDRDYMKHMVKDHEEAVALFTKATKQAKNPALREFAVRTLPTIQAHLDDAKKLNKE